MIVDEADDLFSPIEWYRHATALVVPSPCPSQAEVEQRMLELWVGAAGKGATAVTWSIP